MPLTIKSTATDFDYELPPAGTYVARCYSVVDLGEQLTTWQGQEKYVHKVRISWELPTELMADGRPFSISRNYTLSLNEKSNLYHDLISWRGRAFTEDELALFDLYSVLTAPAMINVIHKPSLDGSRTYANVGSVSRLPAGLECPAQINPTVKFSLQEYTDAAFYALPEWLQSKINTQRHEHPREPLPPAEPVTDTEFVDDIPF